MKTLENLNGIQLYESTDVLPERFTNGNITRLTIGKTYNVIGLCHVAESTNSAGEKINAWDGVLIENAATGKQFPVSVNSLFAIGFFRKTPTAKAEVLIVGSAPITEGTSELPLITAESVFAISEE